MNNVDRILRVLYSDPDLSNLAIWNFGHEWNSDSLNIKINKLIETKFAFSEPCQTNKNDTIEDKQWQFMIERYMQLYPQDYNDNEIAIIFNSVFDNAKNEFSIEIFNSILLFPYCGMQMLQVENDELFIKSDYLFEWEGLNNKIDSNVIFAAFNAFSSGKQNTYLSAKHSDSRLRKILSKGFAENHAHLKGSGFSPELSWYAFNYLYYNNKTKCLECLENVVKARWRELDKNSQDKKILAFKKIPIIRAILSLYSTEYFGLIRNSTLASNLPTKIDLDIMLRKLFLVNDDLALNMLLEEDKFAKVLDSYCSLFIDNEIPNSTYEFVAFEQKYLFERFMALKDGVFSNIALYAFNVYIAAISQFKFCVVQDNLNIGFKRFSRFEREKDVFIDWIDNGLLHLYESVFDKYYQSGGVKYTEFRVAPKVNEKKHIRTTVKILNQANTNSFKRWSKKNPKLEKIDYGIIVHYIKEEKLASTDTGIARKEKMQFIMWKQFLGLCNLYDSNIAYSDYVHKIVGIDAANFEITTRPEAFGPVFKRFNSDISKKANTGVTYHAGEDFVTLANGLRAIDETLTFIKLQEGDRIGHATALGIDVDEYFKAKRSYITNFLQEHVDDLAWMHKLINESEERDGELLHFLNRQYYEYGKLLFDDAKITVPSIEVYQDSMMLRGNDPDEYFNDRQQKSSEVDLTNNPDFYYYIYQYDGKTKKKGLSSLVIEARPSYIEAVKLVQRIMVGRVHDKYVTIEVNPTSNRKISYVKHFIDLQIFRLNNRGLTLPEEMNCPDTPNLPLTINTDNGGVFQTDLALEYALIVEALKRKKVNSEEIYPYIDYLRELSLFQSFVNGKDSGNMFVDEDDSDIEPDEKYKYIDLLGDIKDIVAEQLDNRLRAISGSVQFDEEQEC